MSEKENKEQTELMKQAEQIEQKEQHLLEELNQRLIAMEKAQKARRIRRYVWMGINFAILGVLLFFVIPGVRNISEQYQSIKQEYDQMQAVIDSIDVDEVNNTLEQVNALDIDKVNAALDQVSKLDINEVNEIAKTINDSDLEGTMEQLKTDLQSIENIYDKLKAASEAISTMGGIFG